jgi:hypothetical protein
MARRTECYVDTSALIAFLDRSDPRNPTYIQTIRDIGYRFETGDA